MPDTSHDLSPDPDAVSDDQLPPEAVIRVDIDAAPDEVWQAITTDDGLAEWLGEGSSIGSDVGEEIDIHDIVTGERKRGVLDEFSPGHRLGYTWWPETRPGEATRVAISVEPTHSGTRVTVVESRPLAANSASSAQLSSVCRVADWTWRSALLTVLCRSQVAGGSMRGDSVRASHGR